MATSSAVMASLDAVAVSPEATGGEQWRTEEDLVTENLPLVRYIAARIGATIPASVELDDLIQTGTLGLIDAVRRYDPSKGIPFPAYARYRIRGAILDALRTLDWATRTQRNECKALSNAATSGAPASSTEVRFVSLGPVVSLSTSRESSDDQPVQEVPCAESFRPDRLFEASEAKDLVERALQALPDRYRQVVVMYYSGDWSMREIGRSLGVNESRVSQIHKAALGKMKRALASEGSREEAIAC
jgi:RNA polymerase sigma factor for flagellar operon FliA